MKVRTRRAARLAHVADQLTRLDVLARMLTESRFDFERPMVGLEIELNLVEAAPRVPSGLVLWNKK